jgi:hypothetical protein
MRIALDAQALAIGDMKKRTAARYFGINQGTVDKVCTAENH